MKALGRGLAWFVATFILAELLLYIPLGLAGPADAFLVGRAMGLWLVGPLFFGGSVVAGFFAARGAWRRAFAASGVLFALTLALLAGTLLS